MEDVKMTIDYTKVNWKEDSANITPHFKVHEALWLPSWRVYHIPSDEEKMEIIKTAQVMEKIREIFSASLNVHCWITPLKVNAPGTSRHGGNYNEFIGSRSTKSAHIFGKAVDFHVTGRVGTSGCELVRQEILPHLEVLNIRMEDISGGWVHIDTNPVVHNRFFKP